MFEVYSGSVNNFKVQYYIVTSLTKVAHMIIFDIQSYLSSRCSNRFP